jgi:hypothetical protein
MLILHYLPRSSLYPHRVPLNNPLLTIFLATFLPCGLCYTNSYPALSESFKTHVPTTQRFLVISGSRSMILYNLRKPSPVIGSYIFWIFFSFARIQQNFILFSHLQCFTFVHLQVVLRPVYYLEVVKFRTLFLDL